MMPKFCCGHSGCARIRQNMLFRAVHVFGKIPKKSVFPPCGAGLVGLSMKEFQVLPANQSGFAIIK